METTTLSSKGQVIIPAAMRSAQHWNAGLTFEVEQHPQGVLLKPMVGPAGLPLLRPTTVEEVAGCLKHLLTRPVSDAQIRQAGAKMALKKHRARR